jgi:hypothetical protein
MGRASGRAHGSRLFPTCAGGSNCFTDESLPFSHSPSEFVGIVVLSFQGTRRPLVPAIPFAGR